MAVKRILRYIKGTLDVGILFPNKSKSKEVHVQGYTDSDWCGDKDDRKSTAGYVFMYGDAPISWCSKKEPVVALSSCEAEYIAAAMSACQAAWLDKLLQELKVKGSEGVRLLIDNKSAINLAKHPVAHGRSKHIETQLHYMREQVNKGKLTLLYCYAIEQLAYTFTKPLKGERFRTLREKLSLFTLSKLN